MARRGVRDVKKMRTNLVNRAEEGIVSLILVVMTVTVFVEVVLRFGFNTGMVWADQFVLHLSAWMVLLGASYGVKVGSHIGVDFVVRMMPPTARRITTAAALLMCLAYCSLFIYGSWFYLAKLHKIGIEVDDIPIAKWIAHSVLLIGFVLLALRFLILLVSVIQGKADSFHLADEAREALDQFEQEPVDKEAKA